MLLIKLTFGSNIISEIIQIFQRNVLNKEVKVVFVKNLTIVSYISGQLTKHILYLSLGLLCASMLRYILRLLVNRLGWLRSNARVG